VLVNLTVEGGIDATAVGKDVAMARLKGLREHL